MVHETSNAWGLYSPLWRAHKLPCGFLHFAHFELVAAHTCPSSTKGVGGGGNGAGSTLQKCQPGPWTVALLLALVG